ncbi:hypothetical protein HD806DRAFT_529405 [Xylariaceae sp. AK1471]|nr:hypothetical protein HD806DRAFT_529405 [Xylariaceae sp. AK1471]
MSNTEAKRSQDSIIRGVRVKDITTGSFWRVLRWAPHEDNIILAHIRLHRLNKDKDKDARKSDGLNDTLEQLDLNKDEKVYNDLDDLLKQLDLDGFDKVKTADGKDLGAIIRRHVQGEIGLLDGLI